MSFTWICHITYVWHIWMSYVIQMNKSCQVWIITHQMSGSCHAYHMNESRHKCECVLSNIWLSHTSNEWVMSQISYAWVTSQIWISHVTHRIESCHRYKPPGCHHGCNSCGQCTPLCIVGKSANCKFSQEFNTPSFFRRPSRTNTIKFKSNKIANKCRSTYYPSLTQRNRPVYGPCRVGQTCSVGEGVGVVGVVVVGCRGRVGM